MKRLVQRIPIIPSAKIYDPDRIDVCDYDELYYDDATQTLSTKSQEIEIERLKDNIKGINEIKQKQIDKEKLDGIISYFYKRCR